MTTETKFPYLQWNYFLALEADLLSISRFVEISRNNFTTFSIELSQLLLSTGSEIDVVAKQLCYLIEHTEPAANINQYQNIICQKYPEFVDQQALMPRFGLVLVPWKNWTKSTPPDWWTDHNKVKHHRSESFEKANLSNVLSALSALFIVLLYFYRQQSTKSVLVPTPTIFEAPRSLVMRDLFLGGHIGLHFK